MSSSSRPLAVCLVSAVAALAAACKSAPLPSEPGYAECDPATMRMNAAASGGAAPDEGRPSARSESRPLAFVNGEVITYRDVLLRVGPQLATVGTDQEREAEERRALVDILRDRILHRAAVDAGIEITRDELDVERARRVREIERNGGTLDGYLAQLGETRREFDEDALRSLRAQKYLRAAVGMGNEGGRVRVRPVTDIWPSPAEMRAFYDRNVERFRTPDTGRVRVLPVLPDRSVEDRAAAMAEARRRADSYRGRLAAGEDWVPVFREATRDAAEPDPNDGLYEITERGAKAQWIEDFAFTQPKGRLHVEERPTGFYVLQAEGFTPARQVPYEEVQQKVQILLGQLKRVIASYEVELDLLEEATVLPRERYDDLRLFLTSKRRQVVQEAGL